MLEHTPNHDQMFDATLRRAIPFMIFAPTSFAAQLAARLGGLWRHYASHDSVGDSEFLTSINGINKMLDAAIADSLDPETIVIISDFTLQRSSYNNRLIKLEQDVREIRRELAKQSDTRKPEKEPTPSLPSPTVPSPASMVCEPVIAIATPTIDSGICDAPAVLSVMAETPVLAHAARGRKKFDDSAYKVQLEKMDELLSTTGLSETTKVRYRRMARSLLLNYGGAPSKEQYLADVASKEYSPATVRDTLNVLGKLHEAINGEAISGGSCEQPTSSPPTPIKNNMDALQSPENKSVGNADKIEHTVSKPGDRMERLKKMADHYRAGDTLTMDNLREFSFTTGQPLSDAAIDGTLRVFAKMGYAEKLSSPYTYKRTGKQWDESG